jgi:hypothetical protein
MIAKSDPLLVYGAPFPARVGPFVRGEPTDHETRTEGGGYGIPYRPMDGFAAADRVTVTTFHYPARALHIAPEARAEAILREAHYAIEDLHAAARSKLWRQVTITGHRWLEVGSGWLLLLVDADLRVVEDGEERFSSICVTTFNDRIVKTRVTAHTRESRDLHAYGFNVGLIAGIMNAVT